MKRPRSRETDIAMHERFGKLNIGGAMILQGVDAEGVPVREDITPSERVPNFYRADPIPDGIPITPEAPMPAPAEQPTTGTFERTTRKVGRNEPCPCGSGEKYKKCCGARL